MSAIERMTDGECLQALIMVENGYSVSDICRKLGRCRSTICRLFRKEGVDYLQKKGR